MFSLQKQDFAVTICCALLAAVPAMFVEAAPLDTHNRSAWSPNSGVAEIAVGPHTTLVGGYFSYFGPNTGGGVPIDIATSKPLEGFSAVNGDVFAAVSDGSGGWYIGGDFTKVGDIPRKHFAHIDSNGAVDPAWNLNPDGKVKSLLLDGDVLYVGGFFVYIAGTIRSGIAAIDVHSRQATSWDPHADGSVECIARIGGVVYVGGLFRNIGGKARKHLAALDAVTGIANDWNPVAEDFVYDMVAGGTKLIVSGAFREIGDDERRYLAAIDKDTGIATDWNPSPDSSVSDLEVTGTDLYVAGGFTNVAGENRNGIAAFDAATGSLEEWFPAFGSPASVSSMAIDGSVLYLGGSFLDVGGSDRLRLAAVDRSTGLPLDWNPRGGGGPQVLEVSNSSVFAGGYFPSIGGVPRTRIAALDSTSGAVETLDLVAGPIGISSICLADGTFYVCGDFETPSGKDLSRLVMVDEVTRSVTEWNSGAIESPGEITVSGNKLVYADDSYLSLFELDGDGKPVWTTRYFGSRPLPTLVHALEIVGDTLYVAGAFHTISNESRYCLAALDLATGEALPWDPAPNGFFTDLAASEDTLYVSGTFYSIQGQPRSGICAFDLTTGILTPWDPGIKAGVAVWPLVIDGPLLYVAGDFTEIGGQPRDGIAALELARGQAVPWNPQFDGGGISAIGVGAGAVLVGGSFSNVDESPCANLARFELNTSDISGWAAR